MVEAIRQGVPVSPVGALPNTGPRFGEGPTPKPLGGSAIPGYGGPTSEPVQTVRQRGYGGPTSEPPQAWKVPLGAAVGLNLGEQMTPHMYGLPPDQPQGPTIAPVRAKAKALTPVKPTQAPNYHPWRNTGFQNAELSEIALTEVLREGTTQPSTSSTGRHGGAGGGYSKAALAGTAAALGGIGAGFYFNMSQKIKGLTGRGPAFGY